MRILLFTISIYDTIDDIKAYELKEIIDKLSEIADMEDDQKIIISICDNTENKELFMYYIRQILDFIKDRRISLGRQFLGNLYYKDIINSGAILYNKNFIKEDIILDYVNSLEEEDNFVNLYYVDGNMNDNVNETFKNLGKNSTCTLIKEGNQGIIKSLDNIAKNKTLEYKQ